MFATLRRLTIEKPYIIAGTAIGFFGIGVLAARDPIRRVFGMVDVVPPPMTFPMPQRTRNPPAGYEDDE
ncbi:hypothetical protein GGF32_009834 [Allomyces javanicus]|nr:hypothetical protein GGF32_009834 [Allomyces javanicus]